MNRAEFAVASVIAASMEDDPLSWLRSLAAAIDVIVTVLSIISIVACFALLLTFGTFRSLRTFAIKLICFLALCIMLALAFLLMTFEVSSCLLC